MEQPISQIHSKQSVELMLESINHFMELQVAAVSAMEETLEQLLEVCSQNTAQEMN